MPNKRVSPSLFHCERVSFSHQPTSEELAVVILGSVVWTLLVFSGLSLS